MDQCNITYSQSEKKINPNSIYFFGTRVDNIAKASALEIINNFLKERENCKPQKIFFTNVHTIHLARKNRNFAEAINRADLVLPDGSGLKIAGCLLSKGIKANLNGTDFIPPLLKKFEETGLKIYLLGADSEVLNKCISRLRFLFPDLKIAGYRSGYFKKEDEPFILQDIKNCSPDILLVALGSPAQELFINNFADELGVPVSFAVGGLFDFLAGDKRRAPVWLRNAGLEWLYRFFQDPKTKWNRVVIEIPVFLTLILFKKFFSYNYFSILNKKFS